MKGRSGRTLVNCTRYSLLRLQRPHVLATSSYWYKNSRSYSSSSTTRKIDPSKLKYENPLVDRYTSKEMNYNWSPQKKFSTWRRLWIALAQGEKELGIPIEGIEEMIANADN